MQQVTADLAHFVTIYIDDVLVRSNDESSMVDYIERFLKALTRHNLKLSPSKSEIGAQEISFLGYTISPRGQTRRKKGRCVTKVTYAEQRIGVKITPRRVKLLSEVLTKPVEETTTDYETTKEGCTVFLQC